MRDQLENLQISKEEAVQQTLAEGNDQIVQLRETASALRDQLEKIKIDNEERFQVMERDFRDEKAQLQQAVVVLRQQLEDGDASKQRK